jgi:hypothetical protein
MVTLTVGSGAAGGVIESVSSTFGLFAKSSEGELELAGDSDGASLSFVIFRFVPEDYDRN